MLKRVFYIIILSFIVALSAWATSPCTTCTYPGTNNNCGDADDTTFCAATLSLSDVQDALDAGINSGETDYTIYLPSGTSDWGSGNYLIVESSTTKNTRIIGYGKTNTIINNLRIRATSYSNSFRIVEIGHLTGHGQSNSGAFMYGRMRPAIRTGVADQTLTDEIYWHDLAITLYNSNYNLHFEGWKGVISGLDLTCLTNAPSQGDYGITVHGDGHYSDSR